jgi:hypothetical protein
MRRALALDFFDPTPEQQIVVLIDSTVLRKQLIEACKHCSSDAEIPLSTSLIV